MGGGGMDETPSFNQLPGGDWRHRGFPWGRRGPVEPEAGNPSFGYGFRVPRGAEHVGTKPSSEQRAPMSAPRSRNVVVWDGTEDGREQSKQTPSPPGRERKNLQQAEELTKQSFPLQEEEEEEEEEEKKQEVVRNPRSESHEAAATCIQRWHRGFLVRKTDPLTQLRVIKQVRDKLKEFQEVACKPEFVQKARDDHMERLRFDESVMKEVLKLDSLQGVHALVRDVRKATARDLVRLQDVIDAAVASGRPICVDDLKYVATPVESSNECEDDISADAVELVEQPVGDEARSRLEGPAVSSLEDYECLDLPDEVSLSAYWGPEEDEGQLARNRSRLPDGTADGGMVEESFQQASPSAGLHPSQQLGTELPSVSSDVFSSTAGSAEPDGLSGCRDYYLDGEEGRDCSNTGAVTPDQDRKSNPSLPQEESSKVEILQTLWQENQELRKMIERMSELQALSISSLTERVQQLEEVVEEQMGKTKRKAGSCRKVRSRS